MKNSLLILILLFSLNSFSQNSAPGLEDVIGRGYDIFGQYASSQSVKYDYPIFDFSKCKVKKVVSGYTLPSIVNFRQSPDHKINEVSGSSINEYSENLSRNVNVSGSAQFFSGSISSNFGNTNTGSEQHFYQTLMDVNSTCVISLNDMNLDTLYSILDNDFKNNMENPSVSPETFFNYYGTHFIRSALMGGRIDYSMNTTRLNNESITEIQNYAKAQYGLISADAELKKSTYTNDFSQNTTKKLSTIGGSSLLMNNINSNENYITWAQGIPTNTVLCGFTDKSLRPIWDLCIKNEARKQQLKSYYEETILSNHKLPEIKAANLKFVLTIEDIYILTNCESGFDKTGEFVLEVKINGHTYKTDEVIHNCAEKSHCYQNIPFPFEVPNNESSIVEISITLKENDYMSDELFPSSPGALSFKMLYPFNDPIFNGSPHSPIRVSAPSSVVPDYCKADITYSIKKL